MVRVSLVRVPHPHPSHRSRCHGGHRCRRSNGVRPWGHGQRAWGQGGYEGNVVRRAAQGERVIGWTGEAHGIQRAVDVLGVQTVQSIKSVQSVVVVSVVSLVC